jgi:NAD(P)-dependent dehydrogenase (short-subunit alcohol dehydrogenase family)
MKIADTGVLVTGANRGLGRALVEKALRRGAKRVYAGTRPPDPQALAGVGRDWGRRLVAAGPSGYRDSQPTYGWLPL